MKLGVCVASKKKNPNTSGYFYLCFDIGYLLVKFGINKTCLKKGKLVEVI